MRQQPGSVLGKIADPVDRALAHRARHGTPDGAVAHALARGAGWSVADVVCTSGPGDRRFEERHDGVSVAIVVAGTFQYRSAQGTHALTPGSLLLGNAGECYECGHDHAAGDRCIGFRYTPDYVDGLLDAMGTPTGGRLFRCPRVPPVRASSTIVARACAALLGTPVDSWEELALDAAATAIGLGTGRPEPPLRVAARAVAQVTESVREIERNPAAPFTLAQLAADSGQSAYHFLRTFRQVTGATPHQFVLRTRLREAATRLLTVDGKVIDAAFGAGFGDVSNFNHAFRAEFGSSPRGFRSRSGRRPDDASTRS
jgi:AraC family transcriptional regulator